MSEDAAIERNLTVIKKCFIFKVPANRSAAGYKATEFPATPMWTGRLRVVHKGSQCTVVFEHIDKDGVYAFCHYDKNSVEPVTDSSRYFVIKISDGKGHHAYVGLGFQNRDEAFDFKVALQDFDNQQSGASRAEEYLQQIPAQDLSLPEGEKLTVSIGGGALTKKKKSNLNLPAAAADSPAKIAPPPKKGTLTTPIKPVKAESKEDASKTGDVLGLGIEDDFDKMMRTATASSVVARSKSQHALYGFEDDPFAAEEASPKPAEKATPSGWVAF